jgi:hypothetical protein
LESDLQRQAGADNGFGGKDENDLQRQARADNGYGGRLVSKEQIAGRAKGVSSVMEKGRAYRTLNPER